MPKPPLAAAPLADLHPGGDHSRVLCLCVHTDTHQGKVGSLCLTDHTSDPAGPRGCLRDDSGVLCDNAPGRLNPIPQHSIKNL